MLVSKFIDLADIFVYFMRIAERLKSFRIKVVGPATLLVLTSRRHVLGAHVVGSKQLTGRLSDKGKRKQKLKRVYKDLDPKHA
jgi:hypothetical protein